MEDVDTWYTETRFTAKLLRSPGKVAKWFEFVKVYL